MMAGLLALLVNLIMVTQVMAGTWTSNNFLYKPAIGARGEAEKAKFDSGLNRVDSRLAKEIWLGDPGGTPGYDTLAHAITTIGSNSVILRVAPGTVSIATDTIIPANVTLKPERGATFAVATGKTLTINGTLEAGPYQIFSGSGSVVIAAINLIQYGAWTGGSGVTISGLAIDGSEITGITAAQVGLGNVTNDAQLKATQLDTDPALAANSDTKIPSQKAVKAYADAIMDGATSWGSVSGTLSDQTDLNDALTLKLDTTALAVWGGTANITTLGMIGTGTWNATAIGPTKGGTGQTAVTTGDLLFGSAINVWSKLPDVATGNALLSGGVGTAPLWGKIGLTTHVSGILGAANGGTGNGFTAFTGPTAAIKTFTLPDASKTLLATDGDGSSLIGLTKSQVGLGNVENTALSTWSGSANLTTFGTIGTGMWHGTAIGDAYISSAATWNAKEPGIAAGTTAQYWRGDKSWQTLNSSAVGLGNVTNDAQIKSANFPSSSVDSEIALFSDAGGKSIKRATGSGIAKITSGVLGTATAGTDYLAPNGNGSALTGLTATQVGLGNVTNDTQIPLAQKAAASGVASLNASSKVVQDPANASATPAAGKIPIADGSGKLDAWVTVGGGNVMGGSASASGELASYGDTTGKAIARSYAAFAGPATVVKTFILPNANATLVYQNIASQLLGTGSGATGSVAFYNATNNNPFTIQSGVSGASISWTLPTAAPSGNGYLVTASTAGVLSYTNPSTLGGGTPAWQVITAKPEITIGDTGYATFAAAVTTIGTTSATLAIPSGNHVAGGVTVPATLSIKPLKGALFTIANGTTLTINSPLDAGLYPIFSCAGTGKVTFAASTKIQQVYPQWWGATGDGSTDDTLAVAAAVASVETSDIPVFFPKGSYLLTRQTSYVTDFNSETIHCAVKTTGKIKLRGNGALIKVSAADADRTAAFAVVGSSGGSLIQGVSISGLRFQGTGTPSTFSLMDAPAIVLEYCQDAEIADIEMNGTRRGISVKYSENCLLQRIQRWVTPMNNSSYTSHVAFHSCTNCSVKDSNFWGAPGDGDVVVFGAPAHPAFGCSVDNVRVHAYAKGDAAKTIVWGDGQGILFDTGTSNSIVTNSYAYGYCYGIDVKGEAHNCIVNGNIIEKCWVGIAVRNGEVAGNRNDTVISNNIIHPNGGNGRSGDVENITGMTTAGIMVSGSSQYGTTVIGNTIANQVNNINSDFCGILCVLGGTSSYYEQTGCNIIGNHITTFTNQAAGYSVSKIWAMYFAGADTAFYYQQGLNVTGNQIKVNDDETKPNTQPIVYGQYLSNFSFSNNVFLGEFRTNIPVLDFRNCNMVKIAGNNFPATYGTVINLDTANGVLVSGNMISNYGLNGGVNSYFINSINSGSLAVEGNQKYYAQAVAENELVKATGMESLTVLGNHLNLAWATTDQNQYLSISGLPIESMTRAAACVVTWTGHGKTTGDKIKFAGITQAGWTALNGNEYPITYINSNTFSIAVNTSGYAGDYVPATDPGTYWFQEIAHNQITKRTR